MALRHLRLTIPKEQWRRNRLAICIASSLVFAGFTFVMPFLPLYVSELGVRQEASIATWSGLLITTSPLIAAFLAPLWGRLADRFGMKIMVERAMVAATLHWALFGFAKSPYQLWLLRAVMGMFGGFGTMSVPLLISTIPRENVGRSVGMLQTVQIVSAGIGPMMGGFLADSIGIRKTCMVSACFALVALVMIHRLYLEPSSSEAAERKARSAKLSFRSALALPSFGSMLVIAFFVNLVERSFAPIVPLYVLSLGTKVSHVAKTSGMIISLGLLSEGASATMLGNWLRRVQARKILIMRLIAGALICIPMGLVTASTQLLVLRAALGLLAGGSMVVIYTLGSQMIPEETRATSFSFLASSALLGSALGPTTAGAVTHLDIRAVFFLNSLILWAILAVTWKSIPGSRNT